jgi:DNA modification methylase
MEKAEQCSGMRNKRSVWTVATQPFPEAHFATFPEELIKPCILAGCPAGGTVLDPFGGSGTTGLVARANGCKAILIELSAEYVKIAEKRLRQEVIEFPVEVA